MSTDPRDSQDAVTTPVGVTTMCPQCGAAMPAFETRCSSCGHHRATSDDAEQREALRKRLQVGVGDAFELVELIGKGGMGVVFRARERALDRDVALKVLAFDPMLVPEAFARFEREAKLAARLDHPHIVPIFAVGQGSGIAYYTMRLVRGGSLEDLLAVEKKLEPARAVRYLREIAAALDHAHAHNVVHRDIKPANIMLGDGDHVFVADFGIARAVGGDGGALTSTGVVGSPAYMAPEQWQGQGIDGRADQYALGILAYEVLTGKRPYRDASMHELLRLHLTENLPDITQDLPSIPLEVRDALAKATAKEPAERFASASAFVNELERALFSRPTPAQSAPTVTGVPVARPAPAVARPAAASAPAKSSRWLPIAAVLVLGAAGGGYAWWSSHQTAAPPPAAAPETIRVATPARPETVRVATKAAPETVRVPTPPPTATTAGNAAGAGAAGASVGATGGNPAGAPPSATPTPVPNGVQSYVAFVHPLSPGNQYMIDGQPVPARQPPIYPVAPGRHVLKFTGFTPTVPAEEMIRVLPGDTVRAIFAPQTGGGARGDQLRQQVAERLRRLQQQMRGGGPGRRGAPPARGDTLSRSQ